jgi:hypothetical protein
MAVPEKESADYTERLEARLNSAKTLKTGRDVLPAKRSIVERGLDIRMDLEDDRELVRQGNDRRSPGLTSQAFLPVWVHGAAADAAVPGRGLLDRRVATGTSADLERSGLLQTVSDLQRFLRGFPLTVPRSLPRPVSPDALLIMLAASCVSSFERAYPHQCTDDRAGWGKRRENGG